jgi:SAM-dependent methyltransferase
VTPEQVMAVACYRPLAELPQADEWLARGWSGPVQQVLHEQIALVREEQEIAARLPTLTPIVGEVSEAVRAQYEVNPYPRWRYATRSAAATHIFGRPLPASPRLLIAGCGTGRHAIEATWARAAGRTLAVDLSRRSLAYALRMTRKFGLDNIDYAQADLQAMGGEYMEAFDIVESVGVLHHMSDPLEGLQAVCRMLKPGGLLKLGLYSAAARVSLRPAQELARAYAPHQIRELRRAIIDAPEGDPVRWPLNSRDFYAASSCRDLLMHVQEHQFTVPQLRRMLDENGLEFLGFIQFQWVKRTYQAMFPHDPNGLDLGAWEAFEAAHPNTFGRMYQFWSVKRA